MFAPIKDKRNSVMKEVTGFSNYRWVGISEASIADFAAGDACI